MLCQNCNVNQATVFLHRIVNGQEKEYHLCSQCAKQIDAEISFEKLFQGFLDTFLSYDQKSKSNLINNNVVEKLKCNKCGFTYDDFKNTGKLGCSECYKTFRSDLLSVLKNIQGSVRHNGKMPKNFVARVSKSELEKLKLQLKKAIEKEEYEEAARLRDEIKRIKGENNVNE